MATFRNLLRSLENNPHATLITCFINAVPEMRMFSEHEESEDSMTLLIRRASRYIPMPSPSSVRSSVSLHVIRLTSCVNMFRDNDALFDRYMKEHHMVDDAAMFKLKVKAKHSIIDQWPLRLGKWAAQREFDMLSASGHDGSERYVEWLRAG